MFKAVGIVDLRQDNLAASRDIYDAFVNVGFCYIVNHGVSEEMIAQLEKYSHELFSLPEEEKAKLAKKHFAPENPNIYRGFHPVQLNADSFKEGFEIGDEHCTFQPTKRRDQTYYEKNVWPKTDNPRWDANFRETMDASYDALIALGHRIMRLLAIAFKLDENYFDDFFKDHISTFRLLHYPFNDNQNKSFLSCAEHRDTVLLTLVHQDTFGGLQVENDKNEWIDVPYVEGSFVVNIGRTLEKWTGMKLRATNHRVVAVKGDRYSIPLFLEPNPNAVITPLPGNDDGKPFEPFTYGEFAYHHFMKFSEYQGQLGFLDD